MCFQNLIGFRNLGNIIYIRKYIQEIYNIFDLTSRSIIISSLNTLENTLVSFKLLIQDLKGRCDILHSLCCFRIIGNDIDDGHGITGNQHFNLLLFPGFLVVYCIDYILCLLVHNDCQLPQNFFIYSSFVHLNFECMDSI